jgi:hypothetical protein
VGGRAIRLGDGHEWSFAGPAEILATSSGFRREVAGLLAAIFEEPDEADRRRGELALAIKLLSLNYELDPRGYARLLSSPPDDPGRLRREFRELTREHASVWPVARDHAPSLDPLRWGAMAGAC